MKSIVFLHIAEDAFYGREDHSAVQLCFRFIDDDDGNTGVHRGFELRIAAADEAAVFGDHHIRVIVMNHSKIHFIGERSLQGEDVLRPHAEVFAHFDDIRRREHARPDCLAFQRFCLYEGGKRLGSGRQKDALSELAGQIRRFEFIFCVIELVIVRERDLRALIADVVDPCLGAGRAGGLRNDRRIGICLLYTSPSPRDS